MAKDNYTFGDNDLASARLRRLAEIYEPETRELLQDSSVRTPHLAVDLGCGPGWSTSLLQEVLNPDRTVGLDASKHYIAEARRNHNTDLQFEVHDIALGPFPITSPNVLFCRFLLTQLRSLGPVLSTWESIAAPDAILLIHETETLEADHPRCVATMSSSVDCSSITSRPCLSALFWMAAVQAAGGEWSKASGAS